MKKLRPEEVGLIINGNQLKRTSELKGLQAAENGNADIGFNVGLLAHALASKHLSKEHFYESIADKVERTDIHEEFFGVLWMMCFNTNRDALLQYAQETAKETKDDKIIEFVDRVFKAATDGPPEPKKD